MAKKRRNRKGYTKTVDREIAGFLKTNRKLSSFKTEWGAVHNLVKENWKEIKKRVNEQSPGYFLPEEGFTRIYQYVSARIKEAKKVAGTRKSSKLIDIIRAEFRTETYVSREERITKNIMKAFSTRDVYYDDFGKAHTYYVDQDIRDKIRKHLGTIDLTKAKIEYYDKLPPGVTRSPRSKGNGYMFTTIDANGRERSVFIENTEIQKENGEYIENFKVQII